MSDLIDRQAAIDVINRAVTKEAARWSVEELSSAQPEERTETHACDCISRQAAIDALKEHRALYCDNTLNSFSKLSYAEKSRIDELDTAIATLVNLPSAQPTIEPRAKGEWIIEGTELNHRLRCSCCSSLAIWAPYAMSFIAPNFCPNCGADMREVSE